MRIVLRALALAGLLAAATAQAALAVEPANQACLGKDLSSSAQALTPFGQVVMGVAQANVPFGNIVNAHLSGNLPDSVLPNSCND